jgi:hypothetical protein
MPFRSEAQRRFLFAKHPSVAKEFAAHTPHGKDLPEHVSDEEKKKSYLSALSKLGPAPSPKKNK